MINLFQKNNFKVSLLCFVLFCGFRSQQAFATLEIGYRAGLFLNTGGLNSIVKEYNAKNPWQTFKPIHLGLGGRMVFGAQTEYFNFFAGLKWLRNTQTSSGIDPSTGVNNYKRLIVHYGGIVFGVQTESEKGIGAGIELNAFNYYVLRVQESTTANVKASTGTEIVNDVNPGISLFMRFALNHGVTGISIIPAIDIPLVNGRNDISSLRSNWKLNTPSEPKIMRGYNLSLTLSVLLHKKR